MKEKFILKTKKLFETIKTDHLLKNYYPKIYYVLSGGSAKGFVHLGVLKLFEEIGIYPDGITGTSAGALIGSVYSHYLDIEKTFNRFDQIIKSDFYHEISEKYFVEPENKENILSKINLWLKKGISVTKMFIHQGLIDEKDQEKLYDLTLQDINFENLQIPVGVVATNLITGKPDIFTTGNLKKAIMASTAISLIFPTVKINQFIYSDGGIVANLPIREAKKLFGNDGFFIGLNSTSPLQLKENKEDFKSIELLFRIIDITIATKVQIDIELCDFVFSPIKRNFEWDQFEKYEEFMEYGYTYSKNHLNKFVETFINKVFLNIGKEKNSLKRVMAKSKLHKILNNFDINLS